MIDIYTNISLKNPSLEISKPFETRALVDTWALHLCIPEHVSLQLWLKELQKREVSTADWKSHICSYVWPIQVSFWNRSCYTWALVLWDEVLIWAVPMEDMDLVAIPSERKVIANPKNPNIPASVVK